MSLMEIHRTNWDHDRPFKRQSYHGVALRTYGAISWLDCASSGDHDVHATFATPRRAEEPFAAHQCSLRTTPCCKR